MLVWYMLSSCVLPSVRLFVCMSLCLSIRVLVYELFRDIWRPFGKTPLEFCTNVWQQKTRRIQAAGATVSVITDQRKMIFYKKLLCHNSVVFYTMCKLAANELQRLSLLYCVNLCAESTSYSDVKTTVWSCFTRSLDQIGVVPSWLNQASCKRCSEITHQPSFLLPKIYAKCQWGGSSQTSPNISLCLYRNSYALYQIVLFPVTLMTPNYPKPHHSSYLYRLSYLRSGWRLETSNLVNCSNS